MKGSPMYWETPGNRTDENDYVLLAREESDTVIDKIATSAPVAAISDFNKAFLDLLISSIGFVAALSWNDYIKSLFQRGGVFYDRVGSGGLLYVALFITVLAYVATIVVKTIYPDRKVASKTNPIKTSIDETDKTK